MFFRETLSVLNVTLRLIYNTDTSTPSARAFSHCAVLNFLLW